MKLYHGTTLGRLESIRKHGLGAIKSYGYSLSKPGHVYLTSNIKDAYGYGKLNPGSSGRVIIISLDSSVLDSGLLMDQGYSIFSYMGIIKDFEVIFDVDKNTR